MSGPPHALQASDVRAQSELARLAPTLLAKTAVIVFLTEFPVMLLLGWRKIPWGVWAAFLDTVLLTLLIAAPLYWLVFRPAAQLAARAAAAPVEARFEAMVEAAQDAIFVVNRDRCIEYVNSHAAQQFGGRREEIVGKGSHELFPLEMTEYQQRNLEGVFETGMPFYEELELTFPQSKLWMGTRLAPIRDDAGGVNAVLGIARDITERKKMEEELRRSAQQFRQLLEALPVATRVIQNNVVVFSNPADAALFGYPSPARVVGTDAFAHVADEDVERLRKYTARRAAGESAPMHYEAQAKRQDRTVFSAEIAVTPILHGGQPASLAVVLDLTERKRLQLFESILPVCSVCGKVRDDTGKGRGRGHWRSLQEYVSEHTDTSLSHGFCPDCYRDYRRQAGLPETPSPRRH